MNYSKDEFFDLMERTEAQGCTHTEKMCKARKYEFTGTKSKPITLSGCGNTTLFLVPYAGLDKNGKALPARTVEVCAVDDDMGRWPRFSNPTEAHA